MSGKATLQSFQMVYFCFVLPKIIWRFMFKSINGFKMFRLYMRICTYVCLYAGFFSFRAMMKHMQEPHLVSLFESPSLMSRSPETKNQTHISTLSCPPVLSSSMFIWCSVRGASHSSVQECVCVCSDELILYLSLPGFAIKFRAGTA